MAHDSLQDELEKLKEDLLKMGRLLQQQVDNAVKALTDKDIQLAQQVIENDDLIDAMEMDIEKRALGLIALKQPVAKDLRLIASIFRIIIDIERMADHAEDIAQAANDLYDQVYICLLYTSNCPRFFMKPKNGRRCLILLMWPPLTI